MKINTDGPRGAYLIMDATRAFAAILVAISHMRDLLLDSYAAGGSSGALIRLFYFATGFGHSGVIIFFVLSGFWISKSVFRRTPDDFWWRYLVDRLSRLWIVLVPALLLGALFDGIGIWGLHLPIYSGATGAISMPATAISSLSLESFLTNLVFLQSLATPALGSNGPLWSVAYEFWFYLWFPAIWLIVRSRRASIALLALGMGFVFPMLAFGFVSWLLGSVLFFLVERFERRGGVSRPLASLTLVSGVLVFAIVLVVARLSGQWWIDPILALAVAWIFLGICLVDPKPRNWIRPIATYGANSSFSLYAIHYPFAALVAGALTVGGRIAPSAGAIAQVLLLLLAAIALGYVFSRVTEANTGSVRRSLMSLGASRKP